MSDYLRRADLAELAQTLNQQRTRSLDVVVRADSLRVQGGQFVVPDTESVMTPSGVTSVAGLYHPTSVALEGLALKLDIPIRYLRKMYDRRPDLFDENVNGWLREDKDKYLLRNLRAPAGDNLPNINGLSSRSDRVTVHGGTTRAFLSDQYRVIDNFDVLLSVLNGLREAGVDTPDVNADLSERAMIVRVRSTGVAALAPKLLQGYRSPFNGKTGEDNPTVWAGFVVRNSEVGSGRFTITPEITVEICSNGMTMTKEALRRTHLGAELDEGIVVWSDETLRRNLDLVASQTKDAVKTFMSEAYVNKKVEQLEAFAGVKLDDPQSTIVNVSKTMGYTQDEQQSILNHFIQGGQLTASGILHAITATAQTVDSADRQYELNASAIEAMRVAAGRN